MFCQEIMLTICWKGNMWGHYEQNEHRYSLHKLQSPQTTSPLTLQFSELTRWRKMRRWRKDKTLLPSVNIFVELLICLPKWHSSIQLEVDLLCHPLTLFLQPLDLHSQLLYFLKLKQREREGDDQNKCKVSVKSNINLLMQCVFTWR